LAGIDIERQLEDNMNIVGKRISFDWSLQVKHGSGKLAANFMGIFKKNIISKIA
jgi:hypothetical protein